MSVSKNACLLALAVGVSTAVAVSGAQTPDTQGRPTFGLSVSYVDVDVTVVDAAGRFVTGLGPEDFQVFEDGVAQTIGTFSVVDLPRERQRPFLIGGRPLVSDVRSNENAVAGRVYVLVLDDLNVSPMRSLYVRRSAREFVERYFGPHDAAAVVASSGRTELAQEFTSDPALLLRAIDAFVGQRMPSSEIQRIDNYYQAELLSNLDQMTQMGREEEETVLNLITRMQAFDPSHLERGARAVGVLESMKSLAEYLEDVPGRRKALLWFSEGLDYPMTDAFSSVDGHAITQATQDAIRAAARANVNFYALDPRGLIGLTADFIEMTRSGAPDKMGVDMMRLDGTRATHGGTQALLDEMRLTQDSLQTLADSTGGFAAVNTNSFVDAFDRIVEASSRYYLLGYSPPNHPRDGRFHRIEVKVNRPGVTVVARRGYPALSPGKTLQERKQDALNRWAQDRRRGGSTDTSLELRAALNRAVQQTGLKLAVQAVPFRNPSSTIPSVALTIELQGSDLVFTEQANALLADTIELSYFALDGNGEPLEGMRSEVNLAVRPETVQRVRARGLRYTTRTPMPPGRYQLRIGARDTAGGKVGTVFTDVLVPDFTEEPLMMSGLLLASTGSVDVLTAQRDELAERLLGAPPSAGRTFSQRETLRAMSEVYDNMPANQARRIEVHARLIDESGREAFASTSHLRNGPGPEPAWSAIGFRTEIPLSNVPAGRYLLRVEALMPRTGRPASTETLINVTAASQ
jgi:VWFA-related protein